MVTTSKVQSESMRNVPGTNAAAAPDAGVKNPRAVAGLSSVGRQILTGAGKANPAIVSNPARYGPFAAGTPYISKPTNTRADIVGDVVQGKAICCYFHAALHSAAWLNYPVFPPVMANIGFYQNAGGAKTAVAVTATFMLDVNGNPVAAQKSPNNEYWACAWEKAYGEFKNLARSTLPGAAGVQGTYPYDPDLLTFGQGSPLDALTNITGRPYTFDPVPPNNTVNTTAYNIGAGYNPDCYTILTNFNSSNVAGASAMTKYPTVAWTKPACPTLTPALAPDHSYSILGRFISGETRYIVLRNPWGTAFNTAILGSLAQAGAYQPATVAPIALGPNSTRGIFAIENGAFNTYFAGFGWVK